MNNENALMVKSDSIVDHGRMFGGIFGAYKVEIEGKLFIRKNEGINALEYLISEWLAYEVASAMGFKFVPATYFCRDENWNFFSLQRYVPNAKIFTTVDNRECERLQKIDEAKFRHIYLFDYLMANGDRHGGNMLITDKNEPIAIDHGLTLLRPGDDYDPSVCYDGHFDLHKTLNEFAYRLAHADFSKVEQNLKAEYYASFRARCARIVRCGFMTVGRFRDKLAL